MLFHVALTAFLIIVYLLSISLSAYAYFVSATRIDNVAVAANFQVEGSVVSRNDKFALEQNENGWMTAALDPGVYEITLRPTGTARTGFCRIMINEMLYHTAPMGQWQTTGEEQRDGAIEFSLQLHEAAVIAVLPCWGAASRDQTYVYDGGSPGYIVGEEELIIGQSGDGFNLFGEAVQTEGGQAVSVSDDKRFPDEWGKGAEELIFSSDSAEDPLVFK